MTEETFSKRNAFRVPDGYFDTLTERIMDSLPQQPKQKRLTLVPRLWRYAAGVAVCVGIATTLYITGSSHNRLVQQQQEREEYINEALDYTMMDNMQIADYLTMNDN